MTDDVHGASSEVRGRVLAAIDNDDLTYETQLGRTVIRWWVTDKESRSLTRAERKHLHALIAEGRVKQFQGWRFGIGGYRRTDRSAS